METNTHNPADYIVPLSIGGLEGRMLHIPAVTSDGGDTPKREILFIYGHHSSLERWWGVMEVLGEFGAVTMPDLPGFGGMDSFYTIGQKPTIDALADYLAAFIKWRYKRKKVTIIGMSFGFAVATRMLQRYPQLTSRVDVLISLAGFAHRDDFIMPRSHYDTYRVICALGRNRIVAAAIRLLILNRPILRLVYGSGKNAKFHDVESREDFNKRIDVEVRLWRDNDLRTAMSTAAEFLVIDNCKVQVDLPVYHVGVANDNYLSNDLIEQHFRIIFNDFHLIALLDIANHSPSVVATAEEAAPFVPEELRRLLSK